MYAHTQLVNTSYHENQSYENSLTQHGEFAKEIIGYEFDSL